MKKERLFQDMSIKERLFVLQMATEIFNDPSPMTDVDEEKSNPLMVFARRIAANIIGDGKTKEAGEYLVALNSTTEVVAEFENVLVKTPREPQASPGRYILAYLSGLENVNALTIASHSYFGYAMKKLSDGKSKPTVTVHFYQIPKEKLGKTICAKVAIKLQTNILTGDQKLVIDATFNPEATKNDWVLVMDILPADHGNEFTIPEMPGKCIRIKPVLRKVKPAMSEIASLADAKSIQEMANV